MSYMDSYNLSSLANTTASAPIYTPNTGLYPDGYMDAFNQPAPTTPTAPVNYQTSSAPAPSLNDILSSGYSDMKFPGETPYVPPPNSTPSTGSGVTFDMIDSANAQGLASPYNSVSSYVNTKASTEATSPTSLDPNTGRYTTVPSPLNSTLSSPVTPMSVNPPTYDQRIRDQYMNTFTDPNMFWDEYSQGQGAQFTNTAARGMAKAGRTGMLPALTSLAHQDYMSNYLPSVRKDMAPGLSYENNWNQNLNQQYGQDLDFSKSNYATNVQKYGTELQYDQGMKELQFKVSDLQVRQELGLLDAEIKRLDINEDTRAHIVGNLLAVLPELSEQEQKLLLQDIGVMIGSENFGAASLQDTVSDTGRTDTDYYGTMPNNDNVGGG